MRVVDKRAFFDKIGYVPHSAGQRSFHESQARFRIPVCGRRYGKSTMAGRDYEPRLFVPKGRYWIVGPTYDLGEKEFRVIWDDLIIDQRLGQNKRVKKAYNKRSGEMYIEMPWQTRIEVRSADHPDALVGESLDGVIMSEAAKQKKETWERFIRPALSDRRGDAIFPTTPEGFNWLYDLWQLGQDEAFPDFESFKFPSWENLAIYPGGREDPEILLLEKTTTTEWFLQEIGADFASFVGKIYPEFDETVHVRKHKFNPMWKNYIAFDWGYVNPLAAVEFQIDPFDGIHIWREHYRSFTLLQEHLRMMKAGEYSCYNGQRYQPEGYHIDGCFGDAADPEATLYVSTHFSACMSQPEAKTNWRQGIDLVRSFLRSHQVGEMDEYGTPKLEPHLYIDPVCVNTIREFNNYRAAQGTRGKDAKDIAQKTDDHAMDALRYGLVHIFELGAKHHLNEVVDPVEADTPVAELSPAVTMGVTTPMISESQHGYFNIEEMVF